MTVYAIFLSCITCKLLQKIAIMKLLLAISQAAFTPENDDDWKSFPHSYSVGKIK